MKTAIWRKDTAATIFAHQRPEAYDIWVSVLRDYAKEQLEKNNAEGGMQEDL